MRAVGLYKECTGEEYMTSSLSKSQEISRWCVSKVRSLMAKSLRFFTSTKWLELKELLPRWNNAKCQMSHWCIAISPSPIHLLSFFSLQLLTNTYQSTYYLMELYKKKKKVYKSKSKPSPSNSYNENSKKSQRSYPKMFSLALLYIWVGIKKPSSVRNAHHICLL